MSTNTNSAVGELPEEKIRQAQFAAGADQQVGIGEIGGIEIGAEAFFRHVGGGERAFGHVLGDARARRGRSRRGRRS